jgi:tetraacyldisaccharide 4'-kinase
LREPLSGLRRADAVVLTRCDQCEDDEIEQIEQQIRSLHQEVTIVRTVHRPTGFTDLAGHPAAPPAGRVGAIAGIARPGAFIKTLEDMDLWPADTRFRADHHHYTKTDAEQIRQWIRHARLDALVTTEKDAVKLNLLEEDWPVPVLACNIGIEMLGDGDTILTRLIDRMLLEHQEDMQPAKQHEEPHEPGQPSEKTDNE